jgi:nucleoside-diphosphate-sugar epimerase
VIGDAADPSTWASLLEHVSVIIDTSAGYSDPTKAAYKLLEDITTAVKKYPQKRFTFIYTSGLWVYGENLGKTVDETSQTNAIKAVGYRPEFEQKVIKSTAFDALVIRPGLVHGRSGSIFGIWFSQVEKGSVILINDDQTRVGPIHTDDLAEVYVTAVERIQVTKGQIFNLANRQTENVTDIIKAMARAANVDVQITYQKATNPFEEALGLHSPTYDISKATSVLSYKQRRPGVVDGMDRYYKSWKAHQL